MTARQWPREFIERQEVLFGTTRSMLSIVEVIRNLLGAVRVSLMQSGE